MLKIGIDKNNLDLNISEFVEKLDNVDKRGQKSALEYASRVASDIRNSMKKSLSTKYNEKTHDSLNLGIDKGGFEKGSKNRKMVNFTLKSIADNWKRARVTSPPLNLYENDTKVYTKRNPYIPQTWKPPITYKRLGTHIMANTESKLNELAKQSEPELMAIITKNLQEEFNR